MRGGFISIYRSGKIILWPSLVDHSCRKFPLERSATVFVKYKMIERERRNAAATKSETRFVRIYKRAAAFGRVVASRVAGYRHADRHGDDQRNGVQLRVFYARDEFGNTGVFALSEKWQQHVRSTCCRGQQLRGWIPRSDAREYFIFTPFEKRMISISGERTILISHIYLREMYDINFCSWQLRVYTFLAVEMRSTRLPDISGRIWTDSRSH